MTTVEMNPSVPQQWRPARWVPLLFALAALTLLPWTVMLARRLPARHAATHWDVTWAGFDTMLALLLGAVAIAAVRRSPWLEAVATAAAALLIVDAWFDITTAASRFEVISAVTEAAVVELPVAVFCLVLARDTERALAWALRSVAASGHGSRGLAFSTSTDRPGSASDAREFRRSVVPGAVERHHSHACPRPQPDIEEKHHGHHR